MLISNRIPKKVVCVETGTILDDAIISILRLSEGVRVFRVKYLSDGQFLSIISRIRPDVILSIEPAVLNRIQLLQLILTAPTFIGQRILFVHLWDNCLDLYNHSMVAEPLSYEHTTLTMTRSMDLLHAVLGNGLSRKMLFYNQNLNHPKLSSTKS